MKALLDTSFLLFCAERGRDYLRVIEEKLDEPIEPVVLKNVVDELRRLASKKGKKGMIAKAALQNLANTTVVSSPHSGTVDQVLQRHAKEHEVPVVTVDAKLAKRLEKSGIPYVTLTVSGKPVVRLILR